MIEPEPLTDQRLAYEIDLIIRSTEYRLADRQGVQVPLNDWIRIKAALDRWRSSLRPVRRRGSWKDAWGLFDARKKPS